MTVKFYSYHAPDSGPSLAVLGAVHGNEKCGTEAIRRVISEFEQGDLLLQRGSVWLMPIANPRAYDLNKRFVERNLNRALYIKETKSRYEDHLDPIVCGFLDRADILLDIHSYSAGGEPFVFLEASQKEETAFGRALDVNYYIHGWEKAFHDASDTEAQLTTEKYMQSRGKMAVTLECGQHMDPQAPQVGYDAILKAMLHLSLMDPACKSAKSVVSHSSKKQRCIKMQKVFYYEEDALFPHPWKHLDVVKKDDVIAIRQGKVLFKAPEDGYLILPKGQPKAGDEWVYFGVDSSFPE